MQLMHGLTIEHLALNVMAIDYRLSYYQELGRKYGYEEKKATIETFIMQTEKFHVVKKEAQTRESSKLC